MSRSLGNTIADSLELSLGYAERMLKGVTPERFARFAAPGGETVVSNHPAFILGHLSLYSSRIVSELGGDVSAITAPESFQKVFSHEVECVDDPEGTIYPPLDEVTKLYFDGYRAALKALREADESALQKANPLGGKMAEKFPTSGSMHTFYCGGHMMMHMGQFSAWRRMEKLGSA